MKIQEALTKGIEILKANNIDTPALEAGVLLCHVLKCDRAAIYVHGDRFMEEVAEAAYTNAINKRAEGVPLQYITGTQEFMSLQFDVNPAVLIPRQDTEVLVETVIGWCRRDSGDGSLCHKEKAGYFLRMADIGTGSGCIAVSLAYYLKESTVAALDISEPALETAKRNALKNDVESRIEFVHSDVLNALGEEDKSTFDVIVSNPPYINSEVIQTLQREVKDHEPLSALDGGTDGLGFYRRICKEAYAFLKPGGLLAFEVGYDQAAAVFEIMKTRYKEIEVIRDLSGIERVVKGEKL